MDSADKKRKLESDEVGDAAAVEPSPLEKEQSLRRIVSLLSSDQVADLLVKSAVEHESVAGAVIALANRDVAQRKLFVRALAWETTSESLKAAFSEYGDIEEGAVIADKSTGRSKGFGFVTFKSVEAAHRALAQPSKKIDSRVTVCNLAAAGSQSQSQGGASGTKGGTHALESEDLSVRKLYVWGLPYETTNDAFLELFSQYGDIHEGSIAFEKNTQKSRGFGFVTYKTAESARNALQDPVKTLSGKKIQAKYALDGLSKDRVTPTPTHGAPGVLPLPSALQGGTAAYQFPLGTALAQYPASLAAQTYAAPTYLNPTPGMPGSTGTAGSAAQAPTVALGYGGGYATGLAAGYPGASAAVPSYGAAGGTAAAAALAAQYAAAAAAAAPTGAGATGALGYGGYGTAGQGAYQSQYQG